MFEPCIDQTVTYFCNFCDLIVRGFIQVAFLTCSDFALRKKSLVSHIALLVLLLQTHKSYL